MRKNPKLKNIKNPQKSAILNPDQLFFSSGAERMSPPTDSIQDPSKDSLSDSSGRKEGRKGGRTRNPFSFKKLFSCFYPSSLPSASGEGAEEVEVSVEVEGGITRNTSFFTAIQTSPILPSSSGSGSGDEEDYVPSKDSLSDSSGRTRNPFSFKKLFSCFSPSSEPSASGKGAEEVEVSVEVEGGITRNTSFYTAIQTSPILPSPSGSGSGDEEDYANHPPPPRTRFVPAYYPPVFLPSFPPTML